MPNTEFFLVRIRGKYGRQMFPYLDTYHTIITKNVSLTFFRSSEDLKDTLLTKLLGKFIELHNAEFFQRQEKLTRGCIALFLPTTSRETGVNPTSEST